MQGDAHNLFPSWNSLYIFLISAAALSALTIYLFVKAMNYWERRQEQSKQKDKKPV